MGLTIGQSIRRKILEEERGEGRQEGRLRGLREALRLLLMERGWDLDQRAAEWVDALNEEALKSGLWRVISASSREELFAGSSTSEAPPLDEKR